MPGIQRAAMWRGREVEGMNQGMDTVFIRRRLSPTQVKALLADLPAQIFLTEEFNDWEWFKQLKLNVLVISKACMPDEVARLKSALAGTDVRLFVRVEAPWVHALSRYDQVCLGVPFWWQTFMMNRGALTRPGDYQKDKLP